MDFLNDLRNNSNINIEFLAKQVVEGFIIGLHKSPFHGFSVEFAEHRIYNPGDSTKDIDWKVFARTDRLYAKQYEEETNLRCQILMDTSSSMYFPMVDNKVGAHSKIYFSALAAASIMQLLKRQRDAFGLSTFNDDLVKHTSCKSSTRHFNLLLSYIQEILQKPRKKTRTNTAESLHKIAEAVHKRSLVIIFSDMLDQAESIEPIFSALQHLKYNKHEVILFHVTDKKLEEQFEYENRPYQFVDLETGEKVKLQSNQIKEYYVKQTKAYFDELRMKCLQYKIDVVQADINEGFHQILNPYLVKRSKMM